jgi:hypothetical protein
VPIDITRYWVLTMHIRYDTIMDTPRARDVLGRAMAAVQRTPVFVRDDLHNMKTARQKSKHRAARSETTFLNDDAEYLVRCRRHGMEYLACNP